MTTLRLFRLLLWVQWRSVLARVRGLGKRSPLLPVILVTFIVGYLLLGYFLFSRGLGFLFAVPAVGTLLAQRIIFLIFGFFFIMLMFSNLIIGFSTLFKNRETDWFLTLPIRHADVYRWKFLECVAISSWALIFLSAPMMAAYGRVNEVGTSFYLHISLIYPPFVAVPAVLGSIGVMLLVAILSKPWAKRAVFAVAALVMASLLLFVRPENADAINVSSEVRIFNQLLSHSRFSLNPFLPSAWMARAVVSWSGGLWREGGFFFLLLLSNALFGLTLGFEVASRYFYDSWTHAFSHRSERSIRKAGARRVARQRTTLLERVLDRLPASVIGRPVRALTLKDTRVFWRDPAQWTQVMIFFGLLSIYVLNLRNVASGFQNPFWTTMISYLNLTACALTLSTLTTRFVFPQFSLEGRRLWIIGMAPLGLPKVLMQKFWSSCLAATSITVGLMITSCCILKLSVGKIEYFVAAVMLISVSLCSMSVSLGAIFPNFKEDNPSKIVSGFGGTLCLVASFVYIVLFVTLLAFPASLPFTWPGLTAGGRHSFEIGACAADLLLSAAAALGPLMVARRRLKNMEF